MTVEKAFSMSHSERVCELAESLAAMKVQQKKGLISKEVMKGGIQMARTQAKMMSNTKYAIKNEWVEMLRLAVGMTHSPMINERYDWEIYQ